MSVNIDYTGANGPAFLEGLETPRIDETTSGGGTYMAQDALIYGATGPRVKNVSGAIHMRNNADDDFADMRANSLVLDGDLTVNGTQTIIDTTTLSVEDPTIEVARNQADPPTLDAGLIVQRGGVVANAQLLWDESEGYWTHGIVGSMVRIGDMVDPTTTQGDLIYRGASALDRLPIGTAGQVLAVNGTATGYTFTDISGTVPNGTATYQHLEWNGAAWAPVADITLPAPTAPPTRTITVEAMSDASAVVLGVVGPNSSGDSAQAGGVLIQGGINTSVPGGDGGNVEVAGGPGQLGGGDGGHVVVHGGNAVGGDGGMTFLCGGTSTSGTPGAVSFYDPLNVAYPKVLFPSNSNAFEDGTRVASDIIFSAEGGDAIRYLIVEDSDAGNNASHLIISAGRAGTGDGTNGGNVLISGTDGRNSGGTNPGGYGGNIQFTTGDGGNGSGAQAPGVSGGFLFTVRHAGSGGTGTADAGLIRFQFGEGGNGGADTYMRVGYPTVDQPTVVFESSDYSAPTATTGPGFRYDNGNGKMQVCHDNTGTWEDIDSGGALPPPSSYSVLQGNAGGTAWVTGSDITLSNSGPRSIKPASSPATPGVDLAVEAGQGGSGSGGMLLLLGGIGSTTGGNVIVAAGDGTSGAGGDTYVRGGSGTTNGSVYLGNQFTAEVQFGGTGSVNYQFQGNTSNRLVTGADGNTIVMDGDTSHWILVDAPSSSGNGNALRIGAGNANGAANDGGDLYLEAGEGGASGVDGTLHLAENYGHNIHAGAPIQQYLGSSTTYVHHVAIYLGSTTAANTWTEVYQSGSRQFEMENNQVVVADIIVSARVNLVVAAFKYKAVITRDNGVATVVIENTLKETLFNNIGADTDFRVTADTTNGTFKVEVKSHIATQTNWTVGVRATSTVGIVV